eukprot:gene11758-biopygen12070
MADDQGGSDGGERAVTRLLHCIASYTHELEAIYNTVQSFLRELAVKVARYTRSVANESANRLSRDRDLDDWRLNRRWFRWAEQEWHRHMVDRFASRLSAQLPRYYVQWYDPKCEGLDPVAYSWL